MKIKDWKTWSKVKKAKYLKLAKTHRTADRFSQGDWIKEEKDEKGMHRGCFYGCLMQTRDGVLSSASSVMGLPEWIVRVSEKIFEGLPKDLAKEFPVKLLEAIPTTTDTEQILKDWNYAVLMDKGHGQYKYCGDNKECKKAVKQCADLFKMEVITEKAADSACSAAYSAADSAARSAVYSVDSAYSAARSAYSADSAARSARSAADSAARSADSAYSARSARSDHYIWLSETLIKIMNT